MVSDRDSVLLIMSGLVSQSERSFLDAFIELYDWVGNIWSTIYLDIDIHEETGKVYKRIKNKPGLCSKGGKIFMVYLNKVDQTACFDIFG